jgi:DNA-binding transcriptional regulator YdaS (Cro superfamily)
MRRMTIQAAIDRAGGQTALALAIKTRQQQVWKWAKGRPIDPEKAPAIERATGIPCEQLRPDINWVRIPDPAWTWHPDGRPLIDAAAEVIKASA